MLGDAAGLAGGDFGIAKIIQQRGFAVVHMPHHRNHRRPRSQHAALFIAQLQQRFRVRFRH